ncbi:MAG TPA: GAF domain-containing protein [Thermodesulfovibrionia bacterium]|nr:GAF domain-containing protein [Thermodesulfovibrionia bacterium]
MSKNENFIVKLIGLPTMLEKQTDLNETLSRCVQITANLLNVKNCSIMLIEKKGKGELFLRVFASFGRLPILAFYRSVRVGEGIAGYVASTGKTLMVEDIGQSEFLSAARRPESQDKSFISTPILINDNIVGVFNVSSPIDERIFTQQDLEIVNIMRLLIAKSIHVIQLQNILLPIYAKAIKGQPRLQNSGETL